MSELDEYRRRRWYRSFAYSLALVMDVYARDCAKRYVDEVYVPWKRCATHRFLYLYASRCPLCLEDAAVSTL